MARKSLNKLRKRVKMDKKVSKGNKIMNFPACTYKTQNFALSQLNCALRTTMRQWHLENMLQHYIRTDKIFLLTKIIMIISVYCISYTFLLCWYVTVLWDKIMFKALQKKKRIKFLNLKTIFHCSSFTIHRAAETAVDMINAIYLNFWKCLSHLCNKFRISNERALKANIC